MDSSQRNDINLITLLDREPVTVLETFSGPFRNFFKNFESKTFRENKSD